MQGAGGGAVRVTTVIDGGGGACGRSSSSEDVTDGRDEAGANYKGFAIGERRGIQQMTRVEILRSNRGDYDA